MNKLKSLIYIAMFVIVFSGCTIAFHNVSTSGKASDVIDETQENTPDISPNIEVPLAIPNLPKVPKVVVSNKEKK